MFLLIAALFCGEKKKTIGRKKNLKHVVIVILFWVLAQLWTTNFRSYKWTQACLQSQVRPTCLQRADLLCGFACWMALCSRMPWWIIQARRQPSKSQSRRAQMKFPNSFFFGFVLPHEKLDSFFFFLHFQKKRKINYWKCEKKNLKSSLVVATLAKKTSKGVSQFFFAQAIQMNIISSYVEFFFKKKKRFLHTNQNEGRR